MSTEKTELDSKENKTENQLTEDTQGKETQKVNGSKDAKPFVEKKSMPGDEFLSKQE
ncbi:MAG: hypothetical protein RL687_13 [Candidatus Parcubacteria bacterium]|jgi:hypothetical protein